MCDIAVVEVLTFGRARDPIMTTFARNIWLLAAMFNVNIVISHIRGLDNTVADLLSRCLLSMQTILGYTSIFPVRMPLLLSPSCMPAFMMCNNGCLLVN